jgi:predicted RNase H-like HicB family nuclease
VTQVLQRLSPSTGAILRYNPLMRLKVVLEPSEDGGFTAYVPSLPGCISEGDTPDDAMNNLREAVDLYLEP